MNWKEIKDNCPLAFGSFSCLFDEIIYQASDDLYFFGDYGKQSLNFNNRDLYDFFDSKEIHISIEAIATGKMTARYLRVKSFDYDIYFLKDNNLRSVMEDNFNTSVDSFNSRTEAETEVFTKAFEILENQLKQ